MQAHTTPSYRDTGPLPSPHATPLRESRFYPFRPQTLIMPTSPSHHHRQTPALLITPSNSPFPTPAPTPAPPFASSIMSRSTSSVTPPSSPGRSSRSSAATLLRSASVMAGASPSPPAANSAYASSSSAWCASSSSPPACRRACSCSAQTPTKAGYVANPSSSGSRAAVKVASWAGVLGGRPRALCVCAQGPG